MKKMWIILAVLCAGLFVIIFAIAANESPDTPVKAQKVKKQYPKLQLVEYTTEQHYQPTRQLIAAQYKVCPPLRPERFRRKAKMLWGIDISDYPDNAVIIFNNQFMLSVKYQLFSGEETAISPSETLPLMSPLSDDIYSLSRQFMFFADTSVRARLEESKYTFTEEAVKRHKEFIELKSDLLIYYDILTSIYQSTIMTPASLLNYIDRYNPNAGKYGIEVLNNIFNLNSLISERAFDMKGDLLSLYIREQSKTRGITVGNYNKEQKKTDVFVRWYGMELTNSPKQCGGELDMHFPWHNYNLTRSFAGNLSFLAQRQYKETNSFIIKYMSGQFDSNDRFDYAYKERQDSIREQIRSNNYYGYALLREFCENPEREMPTLEKLGTSFDAAVINPGTLLYLEPYPDSYDIDTMQPAEAFKAYEMGYVDYYFVEVSKPIESPVAGPDGYAMMLDRTETIYGYVKKSAIQKISESEKVSKQITTQSTRKLGKIDDPDGHVNIRKESNADSEIMSKIADKELFFYWEIPNSNWWYVQTKDKLNGFAHKSRIWEKVDAGSWILDE